MKPESDQQWRDEMEKASLKDMMPDFDVEHEWQRTNKVLRFRSQPFRLGTLLAAASIIVLIAAGFIMMMPNKGAVATIKNASTAGGDHRGLVTMRPSAKEADTAAQLVLKSTKTNPPGKESADNVHHYKAKYMISNGTDCPMEISINQTMKCPNTKPAAITASSTLEPGQSAPLNYTATENVPRNCSVTTDEIEIKSVTTGETITLDEHSSPSTAQEVFSYISGEKRGDVLAGMFTTDCNKQHNKRSLRLDNRAGTIVMQ